ncbi:MAG: penicillin-binding protein 2 [Verrucomicrobia bacterium]|nr:penicillin-binding protein 2 [Verrucomicrobiota bacterium]
MAIRVFHDEIIRLRIAFALMVGALAFICMMLWRIQVARGHEFQQNLERQSIRRVRLPGLRGHIYDRNGEQLAANRPSHCIAIYLEELRQPGTWAKTVERIEGMVADLSDKLGIPPQLTRSEIEAHIKRRLPLPLLAWKDIDQQTLAKWAELASNTPGVDIYTEAVRIYPRGSTACHTLGYVGRATIAPDEGSYHYYLPEMAGKSGIERRFDALLRGEAGGQLMRVDVTGYRHHDAELEKLTREPRAGDDIWLTLDVKVQTLAEEALGDDPGAVVVMDPNNGDVLAIASTPGFNPNEFVPYISSSKWRQLVGDANKPLLNRAVAGAYPPGSTFKPVVAMAALENGKVSGNTHYECNGRMTLGNVVFRCAHGRAHGNIAMREAIARSCNVYFYHLGLACGHDAVSHMAAALGLGEKTGIDIDYEVPGLLPDEGWMRRMYGHGWSAGDTVNLSIGQGALTVTPLQMAVVTSALANGGIVYKPRLIMGLKAAEEEKFRAFPPQKVNDLKWSVERLSTVRNGLKDVIMSDHGTGRAAAVPGLVFAGKTGTAEYGRKDERKYRGWMIAYAPFEKPQYAIAMVVENADSGGSTVGPKLKKLLTQLFSPAEGKGEG